MRHVDLVQGTEAWRHWSLEGLDIFSAQALVKGNEDILFDILIGLADMPPFVLRNMDALRERYRQATGIEVRPACVEHDTLPWLRASLDGIDFLDDHFCLFAPEEAGVDGITEEFQAALQHGFAATGCRTAHLVCFSPSDADAPLRILAAEPDPGVMDDLVAREAALWGRVRSAPFSASDL